MPTKSRAKKDAIALLKADHRKVEQLFKKFMRVKDEAEKMAVAKEICTELTIHTTIEEEIFYPACAGAVDDDIRLESYVEHDGAKVLIAEIEGSDPENEFFDAKMTALCEQVRHHIKEEEKPVKGLMAQARNAKVDLNDLGRQLRMRKEELMEEIGRSGLPAPETHSFTGHKIKQGEPPRASA